MLSLFGNLRHIVKWSDVQVDSFLFRLQCKWTALFLFGCDLVSSYVTLFGSPIQCMNSDSKEPETPMTRYCFMEGTFTMADSTTRQVIDDSFFPGKKYINFYQWVQIALFVQALLCYTPKYFWNAYEKDLLRKLLMNLNHAIPVGKKAMRRRHDLVKHFLLHTNTKVYLSYTGNYFICETLCLVNIVSQIIFMNSFLNGEFLNYGWSAITFLFLDQEKRFDPMIYLFPRITKCDFTTYGPSGTLVNTDLFCLLPINSLNEKIYIVLWFWYVLLVVLLTLQLVLRVMTCCSQGLRVKLLMRVNPLVQKATAVTVCRWANLGNFWIIYMLGNNIKSSFFPKLLDDLKEAIADPELGLEIMNSKTYGKDQDWEKYNTAPQND